MPAKKISRKKTETDSCSLCAKVPGLTSGQVADPKADVCKPGEFDKLVQAPSALVYVRQDGCPACKEFDEKVMSKADEKIIDGAKKIEITAGLVPACDTLADKLKIKATPTLIFYKNGRESSRFEGMTNPTKDLAEIKRRISA